MYSILSMIYSGCRASLSPLSKVLTLLLASLVFSSMSFAKDQDPAVLQELAEAFVPFQGISYSHYTQLKKQRHPGLIQAQQNVYQYLQSTAVQSLPESLGADSKAWGKEALASRSEFSAPLMMQTGLEIIAHELLQSQSNCSIVINALKFLGSGASRVYEKPIGINYNDNHLLIMHLYGAYFRNFDANLLPCAAQVKNSVLLEAIEQNRQNELCIEETPLLHHKTTECRYYDREVMYSLALLAAPMAGESPKFIGGGGRVTQKGLLTKSVSYRASHSVPSIFFVGPNRYKLADIVFSYILPTPKNAQWPSVVTFQPANPWTYQADELEYATKSELPQRTSFDVFTDYQKFAEDIVK